MQRLSRSVVLLAAVALVASACSKAGNVTPIASSGKYGSGVNLNVPTPGAVTPAPGQKAAPQRTSRIVYVTPPGYQQSTGGPANYSRVPSDHGNTGYNAYWYLNSKIPKLTVEMDAVSGEEPSSSSISMLRARLQQVVSKPGGINFLPIQTVPRSPKSSFNAADARGYESRYRNTHNSASSASIWLLFINGNPDPSSALAEAYEAGSALYWMDAIHHAADGAVTISEQDVEHTAIIHEVGHLLSLINFQYHSPRPHEDPNHPGHSNNPNSVMYWAVENTNVVALLGGRTAPPTQFDSDDLADMADVKAGKLGPH